MTEAPFAVGDIVETIKGAKFWGEVVSVYPLPSREPGYIGPEQWRVDVQATAPDFLGTIHVYPAVQLAIRAAPAAAQAAGYVRQQTLEGLTLGLGGPIVGVAAFDTTIPLYLHPVPIWGRAQEVTDEMVNRAAQALLNAYPLDDKAAQSYARTALAAVLAEASNVS